MSKGAPAASDPRPAAHETGFRIKIAWDLKMTG